MAFFFFGMGYSARATARALTQVFDPVPPVFGTTRSAAKAAALVREGVRAHAFDGIAPGVMLSNDLLKATHVVMSIPPGPAGDPVLVHHRGELDQARALQWLCYFSTVGVYGNADGAWIDESAEPHPGNERSRHRLAAERAWAGYAEARGVPLLILRLAGIYGPGRSSFDKLSAGTATRVLKPGQVFNRIHVEDIGRVTALAARAGLAGTFNLCDDEPAPPEALVEHAAALMGVEPPPAVPVEAARLGELARSFYDDNKRVSNARIKKALGIELIHPTYREGLQAIARDREAAAVVGTGTAAPVPPASPEAAAEEELE